MRVELHLFGYPRLGIDGRTVALGLQKGLALVVYAAEARAPVARETLSGLLWPDLDAEAARARLRRTLYRIGEASGVNILAADRVSVALAADVELIVDTARFEAACDGEDFAGAMRLASGDFLAGFSLPGCEAFEEWAYFRREALRSRLVQSLERLIERNLADSDPRAAIEPAVRLVGLDPFAEAAHRQLMRAHLMANDRTAAERAYEICAKLLYEELGVAPAAETEALLAGGAVASLRIPSIPITRYAARGGIHLAYQAIGHGPLDIVFVPGFVSHVERAWEDSCCRRFLGALAEFGRLIFFDRRGVGLSDRIGAPPTVDAMAEDILNVLDTAESHRAILIGASEGGPGSVRFAVDHPQRLAGLVLYGSMARGAWSPDHPFVLTREQYDVWLNELVAQWGGPTGLATFAPSLVGNRQAESWWAGLLRAASSPGAIRGVLESLRDTDVTRLLPVIRVPTLVLHRRGDRAVRVEAGRYLAANIIGAQFVELEGDDHWPWVGDQQAVIEHVKVFARRL
jgi:DNA-binding SARP family transcriptional activator/pimeloyl-ACP methyl ester carboxylesterase